MKELTITQEYALCVIQKEKQNKGVLYEGKYPGCMLISAFLEILITEKIGFDEQQKVTLKCSDKNSFEYLNMICDDISNSKPMELKKWMEHYLAGLSSKPIRKIVNSIIESLIVDGCISTEKKKGLIKDQTIYNTDISQVNHIIEKLRAELLENGEITLETVILTTLMHQSGLLDDYFSHHEKQLLEARIEELKKSDAWAKITMIKEIMEEINTILLITIFTGVSASI